MTEKLFYSDSYVKTFTAGVCSCRPYGEGFEVVLDRTAFFPKGGGQSSDTGKLGGVGVLDVREKDGVILHITDAALTPGQSVTGELDWEKRFSRMQQHTGEHIVSGLVHRRFGYDNVGFHLGEEVCTLDLSGSLTGEELEDIECAANMAAAANLAVEVTYPSDEARKALDYRSKIEIEGQVRIVTVPGVDVCACCAPHVKHTGEIGMIKFIHSQNYKGGVRLTMVCGFRALRDYRAKEKSVRAIMQTLSAKEELIADAVERQKKEYTELKGRLASLQRELLSYRAEKIPEGEKVVCMFEAELSRNGPRELMNLVLDRGVSICAVFAETGADGYHYVIGSRDRDVRELCAGLNEQFCGRGGGKPGMVQGSVFGGKEELLAFMTAAGEEKK